MAGVQVQRLQDKKFEELQVKDQELQRKDEELQRKDEQLQEKNTQLEQQSQELQEKDHLLQQLRLQLASQDSPNPLRQATPTSSQDSPNPLRQATPTSFPYNISGAGLETAIVKTPCHFSIVLYPHSGPCSSSQHVTAELISTTSRSVTKATVIQKSSSTYEVTYTPTNRGRHELCVRVNGDEIQGSPFTVVVYPHPIQLRQPVRLIKGVQFPCGLVFNSHGMMYTTESYGQVAMFDSSGKRIGTIGSRGDAPGQFRHLYYIAIDRNDNVYVTSDHKLQKFDRNGKFVKSVGSGSAGTKPGEFNEPRGIKVHQNQVYVCDYYNNRIQVFDLKLIIVHHIFWH